MKTILLFLVLIINSSLCLSAGEQALFTWNLLWTGYWYNSVKTPDDEEDSLTTDELLSGGTLFNRGNLTLGVPIWNLSSRLMATDKRLLPLVADDTKAGFNPGLGVYHHGSGSRLLYGVQSEYGLPARISNVWLRSVPYVETRRPSSRDFKLEPAARDQPESYLYLALPYELFPAFDAFAYAALDEQQQAAFGGGIGWNGQTTELRLEGFYTRKELAARKASTWFSASPPLPERDFDIYALAFNFYSPQAAFATDWAWSETFAWGQGLYGNAALRLGHRPWRVSLAGDGAGERFADRHGSTAGAGFRLAARAERFWPRSGLLRIQSTIRAPGLEEPFERGSFSLYYRPSAPSAAERRLAKPLRFTRASLGINRDARNPEKTNDTASALAAFNLGPFSTVFSGTLQSLSCLEPAAGAQPLIAFPFFESFESFRVSAELGFRPFIPRLGSLDLRGRAAYTIRAEKKDLLELSLNTSLRPGKWGRVGFRIASTDFPEKWNYTLSWRFTHSGEF